MKKLDTEVSKLKNNQNFFDSAALFRNQYERVYCHCIIDVIPNLLWLDENTNHDVIFYVSNPTLDSIIESLQIKFKKTKALNLGESFFAASFFRYHSKIPDRNAQKNYLLKSYYDKIILEDACDDQNKAMIYCTRNSGGRASHGRRMKEDCDKKIIELCKDFCKENLLDFIIFDGTNKTTKKPMSVIEQIMLFRRAKIVLGPHGGAFSNIIAIPPSNKASVCEFTSGIKNIVHGNGGYTKNYNALFANMPTEYLSYNMIPFSDGSNRWATKINISHLKEFFDFAKKNLLS